MSVHLQIWKGSLSSQNNKFSSQWAISLKQCRSTKLDNIFINFMFLALQPRQVIFHSFFFTSFTIYAFYVPLQYHYTSFFLPPSKFSIYVPYNIMSWDPTYFLPIACAPSSINQLLLHSSCSKQTRWSTKFRSTMPKSNVYTQYHSEGNLQQEEQKGVQNHQKS